MRLFYYVNFERNCDILKSRSPCILLNEYISFNKNKTELKMENPTHNFREPCASAHITGLYPSTLVEVRFVSKD